MRRERGQWYGPARVALVENQRVIWLVHAHRLVRASPEQLRAASMREWKAVRDEAEFKLPTRDWARSIGHQDFYDLDPADLPEPSEPDIPAQDAPVEKENPGEVEVPEPEAEETVPTRRGSMDVSEERPLDGVDVPVPEDDELFGDTVMFGDTVSFPQDSCQAYCWEIDITPAGDIEESTQTPNAFVLAAVNERKINVLR